MDKAHEETLKLLLIKLRLEDLTDEERVEIFHKFCVHCGSKDTGCNCWRDE